MSNASSDPRPTAVRADSTTALILPPTESSFRRIAGLTLLRRTVLSAQRAGFAPVIALDGGADGRLSAMLAADVRTSPVPIANREAASRLAGDRVALIPSDCVLTPATLAAVAACDDELTVFTAAGSSEDIVVGPREAVLAGEHASARRGSVGGAPFIAVRDDASARAAEDRLVADLAGATVETDGPIARLDRQVSTRLSRLLVRTPLTPNQITLIGTTIGLLGAWLLAAGTHVHAVLGTFLFWTAVIIDGCDGEVARLKLCETHFGYLLDVTTDNIVHAAIFLGLGVGVYRASPDEVHGMLPLLLLAGFASATFATWYCLLRHPPVARLAPRSRRGKFRRALLRGFEALMNRDFAYLLLLLAVVNRLYWFLWAAAFGTYLYSAGLVWVYRWRDAE